MLRLCVCPRLRLVCVLSVCVRVCLCLYLHHLCLCLYRVCPADLCPCVSLSTSSVSMSISCVCLYLHRCVCPGEPRMHVPPVRVHAEPMHVSVFISGSVIQEDVHGTSTPACVRARVRSMPGPCPDRCLMPAPGAVCRVAVCGVMPGVCGASRHLPVRALGRASVSASHAPCLSMSMCVDVCVSVCLRHAAHPCASVHVCAVCPRACAVHVHARMSFRAVRGLCGPMCWQSPARISGEGGSTSARTGRLCVCAAERGCSSVCSELY